MPEQKHIGVHYHYVGEHTIAGNIDLLRIGTDLQTTDIFTKALAVDKLQHFSLALGLQTLNTTSLRHKLEGEEPKLSTGKGDIIRKPKTDTKSRNGSRTQHT